MKLNKVKIENFRSINILNIDFAKSFRILVGKNESGKSNLLKALSLLDPSTEIVKEDIRESDELVDSDFSSAITFEFSFSQEETEEVYKQVSQKIKIDNIEEKIICRKDDTNFTLHELCNYFATPLYEVDLIKNKKRYTYWIAEGKWIINKDLRWNSTSSVVGFKEYSIIDISGLSEGEKQGLIIINIEDINDLISSYYSALLEKNHPTVINWKYDESNLLPDKINIQEFRTNPDLVKPLKTMFELAGIENISESLDKIIETANYHKINNYLEKIASKTTNHFRQIWKEYKEIEFTLNADGSSIITGIKEKNTYSFQQRSDGFKRFVTFLLLVSAAYETSDLINSVILIDEPDIALHPSGIRFLRDELIKISNKNIICASTHSIFLIDRSNISRHYIVKKKNEVTEVEEANDDNLITEEVLFNALGYSFYEILKNINIAFEGWRDKELFNKAMEKIPTEYRSLKEKFKDIGITHINGVKEAQHISPIIELVNRKFIIFSDSDEVAIEHKKNFEKRKTFGEWITYKDLDSKLVAKTGEDFLKVEYLKTCVINFKKANPHLIDEPEYNPSHGFIANINTWLNKKNNIAESSTRKELIDNLKGILFDNLKNSMIDLSYYEVLNKLSERL